MLGLLHKGEANLPFVYFFHLTLNLCELTSKEERKVYDFGSEKYRH